jgi:hypothetical protein
MTTKVNKGLKKLFAIGVDLNISLGVSLSTSAAGELMVLCMYVNVWFSDT